MSNQRKDAEQNFINGVEAAIENAVKLNQFDGLQVTVLADLMQIQCIASGDTDLLTFSLPSAVGPMVKKIATHQDVRSIEWVEMGDGLATLIFGNEDEQDKFIQLFEMLSFSRQRAYPTPDIYLGCADPDRQLCTELLKFLNAVSAKAMQHVTGLSRVEPQQPIKSPSEKKISIWKVWVGAIYMQSKVDDFGATPQFSQLSQPTRCYLVEYDNAIWSWKFFWSKPGQYGPDANFITQTMKEDPPRNGERYFNDASKDQMQYSATLTLTNMQLYDGQAFMYRQQFDSWIGAFMGSLSPIELKEIPSEWMNLFQRNAP